MRPHLRLVPREPDLGVPIDLWSIVKDAVPGVRGVSAYLCAPGVVRVFVYVGWRSFFARGTVRTAAERAFERALPGSGLEVVILW